MQIQRWFTILIVLLLVAPTVLAQGTGFQLTGWVRDTYPQVSPDGQQVVFQSNRSGSNQIWIMQSDGSGLTRITDVIEQASGQGAETPAWSPDGRWIAFAVYVEKDNNDVFIMRPDGSEQTRLTHGTGFDDHPHWSADGEQIIFNSNRDTPDPEAPWHLGYHDIWSVRPDGSDEVKLLACETVCTYASLSPDGRKLAYRRVDDSVGLNWLHESGVRNSEVYLYDLDSKENRLLAGHPAFDGWPVWSPDGEWVVFASNRGVASLQGQVWRVRQDGSDLQQVTEGEWSHTQPSVSQDGRSMWVYRFQEALDHEYGGVARIPLP